MATEAPPAPPVTGGGKDEFTVSQLIASLKASQTLVPANIDTMGLEQSPPGIATPADWDKFWAALKKINAPYAVDVEHHDDAATADKPLPEKSTRIGFLAAFAAAGTVASAVGTMASTGKTIYDMFNGRDDVEGRSNWTRDMVARARQNNPGLNYVVICSGHSARFDGMQGRDWGVDWYNFPTKGGVYRYSLYAFHGGAITIYGDGGYQNWAYGGSVVSYGGNPKTIVFGYPGAYGRSLRSISAPTSTPTTAVDTGFPAGCFRIRATGTTLYWTPRWHETHQDGNAISLWSLDSSRESQVLFINANGNLCCGNGAFVDIVGNTPIVVQNRPGKRDEVTPWSHPLPQFTYSKETKVMNIQFFADPVLSDQWPRPDAEWKDKEFVLGAKSPLPTQTPTYQQFAKWAPASSRGANRWTGRAGLSIAANDQFNIAAEVKPAATAAAADLDRIKWDIEAV